MLTFDQETNYKYILDVVSTPFPLGTFILFDSDVDAEPDCPSLLLYRTATPGPPGSSDC